MGVAMVQFLKSFTPVVVAIVSHVVLARRESPRVWASLLALSAATALTAAGDKHASVFGLALAATSSTTEVGAACACVWAGEDPLLLLSRH